MEADMTLLKGLTIGTAGVVAVLWSVRLVVPWWMKRIEIKDAADAKRADDRDAAEKADRAALLEALRDCTRAMESMSAAARELSARQTAVEGKLDALITHVVGTDPGLRVISRQGQ